MVENNASCGEGERWAMRGYTSQYRNSAAIIHSALQDNSLRWINLADPKVGIMDDLVIGLIGQVIGYQFKASKSAKKFNLKTFLTGKNGQLKPIIEAWQLLKREYPNEDIQIRFVTTAIPSTTDKLLGNNSYNKNSAKFLEEFEKSAKHGLKEWLTTDWGPFVNQLFCYSNMNEQDFDQFLQSFRLIYGSSSDPEDREITEIADLLPKLIADDSGKAQWTRKELLERLGWHDSFTAHHNHAFPLAPYVQRNIKTETVLRDIISTVNKGYIALIGPPGVGKSTLLQSAQAIGSNLEVVRYLAYFPNVGHGTGRAEAEDFLDDITTQLKRSGLSTPCFWSRELADKRRHFGNLLLEAEKRYEERGILTLIIIDGLDHVPREEDPQRSFLKELPLPISIPKGVIFLLGTQHLELDDLAPAIYDQINKTDRKVTVSLLDYDAISRMADMLNLDPSISREKLFELSQGYPLFAHYLIEMLKEANEIERVEILNGAIKFESNIEVVYESAWHDIQKDKKIRDVLDYLARSEGLMPLELLIPFASEEAIECALKITKHLLVKGLQGWGIFHNSFRQFILRKPYFRLGEQDNGYSERIYRKLAEIARSAPNNTPQRWLELRYLAHAKQDAEVLQLAQPALFRTQLAQGRSFKEIEQDIRLALMSASRTQSIIMTVQLMLIYSELDRRSTALGYTINLAKAFLAVGDIDSAEAFAMEYSNGGYEVVAKLLDMNQADRAKLLFERLDFLPQTLINNITIYHVQQKKSEFPDWARQVIHFRSLEQIKQTINRLSTINDPSHIAGDLAKCLCYEIVLAFSDIHPEKEPMEIISELDVSLDLLPDVLFYMGSARFRKGDINEAIILFQRAMKNERFLEMPDVYRLNMALALAKRDKIDAAQFIFDGLTIPDASLLETELQEGAAEYNIQAAIKYAQLATLIGRPIKSIESSKSEIFCLLQHYAVKIGTLLGRTRMNNSFNLIDGELSCKMTEILSCYAKIRPHKHTKPSAYRQFTKAMPILVKALIETAIMYGNEALTLVLAQFDSAEGLAGESDDIYVNLQREIAIAIYQANCDIQEASRRLELAVSSLQEKYTASQQMDNLALLAIAFVQVGNQKRARELIGQIQNESLGYDRAPKKDAQYAMWQELLIKANTVDPKHRADRISFLMRQVRGMMKTEGRLAAPRLASPLIIEATLYNAKAGLEVARILCEENVISGAGLTNALLLAIVKRRKDLAMVCGVTWCFLCLPYYKTPHYFTQNHPDDFIKAVVTLVPEEEISALVEILRVRIESESVIEERYAFLQKLYLAAKGRGYTHITLTDALQRWRVEIPQTESSSTIYNEEVNLSDLKTTLEKENTPTENAAEIRKTFYQLESCLNFKEACEIFERSMVLQKDSRSQFQLIRLALKAGDKKYARSLLDKYDIESDEFASWTEGSRGSKLQYFRALIELEGPHVHSEAYQDFVNSMLMDMSAIRGANLNIDEILPLIHPSPDWPAIWELLAEQLSTTREYAIGQSFEVGSTGTEEEVIAALFQEAATIPLPELQQHFKMGAFELLTTLSGKTVFQELVNMLLSGIKEEPAQGLTLLLYDDQDTFSTHFKKKVATLANHPDYAVAEMASFLSKRWKQKVVIIENELPPLYNLTLLSPTEDNIKAELVIDCFDELIDAFAFLIIDKLVRSPITANHINLKVHRLLQEWSKSNLLGKIDPVSLENKLNCLKMRMSYWKPAFIAIGRALRYVAGELRQAGMISADETSELLYKMNYSVSPLVPMIATIRPPFIPRLAPPEKKWADKDQGEKWVNGVDEDILQLGIEKGEVVIAEITTFEARRVHSSCYSSERIRAPFLDVGNHIEMENWINLFPKAIWRNGSWSQPKESATTIVRSITSIYFPEIPACEFIICPNWLQRLQWHIDPKNRFIYLDKSEQIVARIVWWRDGGPIDNNEDVIWGEGVYLSVTISGIAQIEAVLGCCLSITIHANRKYEPARNGSRPFAKVISATDLNNFSLTPLPDRINERGCSVSEAQDLT